MTPSLPSHACQVGRPGTSTYFTAFSLIVTWAQLFSKESTTKSYEKLHCGLRNATVHSPTKAPDVICWIAVAGDTKHHHECGQEQATQTVQELKNAAERKAWVENRNSWIIGLVPNHDLVTDSESGTIDMREISRTVFITPARDVVVVSDGCSCPDTSRNR
jgi:hypothetical protein